MIAVSILSIAAIAVGVTYYLYAMGYESTDDAFIEGHVVPISPRVAGHVAKVHVNDNELVEAGQLLVELDPRDFQTRVAAAEAALASGRGRPELANDRHRCDRDHLGGGSGGGLGRRGRGEGRMWRRPGRRSSRPRASRPRPRPY